ncbi:GNAT family N-acetyltransferase [Streptomyces sp. NPDC058653]|uniref:GNAT family N-acetyltransferase n=1 Tax=Streptomyces sp. NPDC058653 TaxID=3346576 RepID=UPI0036499196
MATDELGFLVRPADAGDADALIGVDVVAAGGDPARQAGMRRWCRDGLAVVAEDGSGPVGDCVVEYTFSEHGSVTVLMVAPAARGRGVGHRLLDAAAGWSPVGLLHGLDEGDPELFHLRG